MLIVACTIMRIYRAAANESKHNLVDDSVIWLSRRQVPMFTYAMPGTLLFLNEQGMFIWYWCRSVAPGRVL